MTAVADEYQRARDALYAVRGHPEGQALTFGLAEALGDLTSFGAMCSLTREAEQLIAVKAAASAPRQLRLEPEHVVFAVEPGPALAARLDALGASWELKEVWSAELHPRGHGGRFIHTADVFGALGYTPDRTAPEKGEWEYSPDPKDPTRQIATRWRQAHMPLVKDALRAWKRDPDSIRLHVQDALSGQPPPASGSGKRKRAQIEALLWELEHGGARPNPGPLYRSASVPADSWAPWRENRAAADQGGGVTTLAPGSARGLRVDEFLHPGVDIGSREWIVLPPEIAAYVKAIGWDPAQHPRDQHGQFANAVGGGGLLGHIVDSLKAAPMDEITDVQGHSVIRTSDGYSVRVGAGKRATGTDPEKIASAIEEHLKYRQTLGEPVTLATMDANFQKWFHPQQLEGGTETHPRSGFDVHVGRWLRVQQPARDVDGPPVFKVTDFGEHATSQPFPEVVGTEPIHEAYRAVSLDEYNQAIGRGYLQSDMRGVIAPWEGTNAGVDPQTAQSYLPRGSEGVIVKMDVRPEDGWFTRNEDGYLRTRQRIPVDRITAVSPVLYKDPEEGLFVRGAAPGVKAVDWSADKHPRDAHGRFTRKPGGALASTVGTEVQQVRDQIDSAWSYGPDAASHPDGLVQIGGKIGTLVDRETASRVDAVRQRRYKLEARSADLEEEHYRTVKKLDAFLIGPQHGRTALTVEERAARDQLVTHNLDLGERQANLSEQIHELKAQEDVARRQATVDVLSQIRPMGGTFRTAETKFHAENGLVPGDANAAHENAVSEVQRLMPTEWIDHMNANGAVHWDLWKQCRGWQRELPSSQGPTTIQRRDFASDQAWRAEVTRQARAAGVGPEDITYSGEGSLTGIETRFAYWLPRADSEVKAMAGDAGVYLHELGHRVQLLNESGPLHDAQVNYLNKRTGAPAVGFEHKIKSLAQIYSGSGYELDERTIEDEFANAYYGKLYGNTYETKYNELLTMATQDLFYSPGRLRSGDPETYNWILGVMATL